MAIIVPFRDREEHLRAFLNIIHPMLQRQLLQYTVFIAEQVCVDFHSAGSLASITSLAQYYRTNVIKVLLRNAFCHVMSPHCDVLIL